MWQIITKTQLSLNCDLKRIWSFFTANFIYAHLFHLESLQLEGAHIKLSVCLTNVYL